MIFITLGSQKFQFDRLLKEVDRLIADGVIQEKVFAQIMDQCDSVITHGGTGVIIGAVKKGKKVIAVPRLAKYGEHVDDHQLQLLHQFDDLQLICACYDVEQLGECYKNLQNMHFRPYVSNTSVVIASIDEYLQSLE